MLAFRSSAGVAILMLLIAPGVPRAQAQEPVHSFEQLRHRVAAGKAVIVTDAKGRQVHGTISELSATALVLNVRGTGMEFSKQMSNESAVATHGGTAPCGA